MTPDELRRMADEIVPSASLAHGNLLAAADAWDIEIARGDGWKALALDYAKQIADLRQRLEAAEKDRYTCHNCECDWCNRAALASLPVPEVV